MEERKEKKMLSSELGSLDLKKKNPRSCNIKALFRDMKVNNKTSERDKISCLHRTGNEW